MRIKNLTTTFKPFPFTVERNRKKQVVITSPAIDWSSLDEDQARLQWMKCANALWLEEREGKISRENIEPVFYEYILKNGYTKDEARAISKLKEWQVGFNILAIAYLLSNGAVYEESKKFFNIKVRELVDLGKQVVEEQKEVKAEKPRKSIQQAMAEQFDDILADLEDNYDELKGGFLKWFQQTNMPKAHVDGIENYYRPRYDELLELQTGKDEQLNEAYANYKKKQIKLMLAWYEELFTDLAAYKRVKQTQRKVRAKKPVSPTKLVAKMQYMQYNDEMKIGSIKPETIIGKDTLWVYNTKTRKLCVYVASEVDKQLSVKGTTILGWDPKLSVGKTLRKPDEQLKKFLEGGKVAMRNFLKNIKGVEAKMNGRINKDVMLLKVY